MSCIRFLTNLDLARKELVYETIDKVVNEQGIPHDILSSDTQSIKLDHLVASGLLMGYPLTFNGKTKTFYFTPDLRNRFDGEGRGDKFEIIKSGISHFENAYWLANPPTGQLRFNPSVLLEKLLENGRAGNATAIGTDYELLVKKGLVMLRRTSGSRYEFLLPDSEKIADLEIICDAFKTRTILPKTDISEEVMGLKGEVIAGDSIVYRSRKNIQDKELTAQLLEKMFRI